MKLLIFSFHQKKEKFLKKQVFLEIYSFKVVSTYVDAAREGDRVDSYLICNTIAKLKKASVCRFLEFWPLTSPKISE